MTLKEHIDDIGTRLRKEEFPNEQAVRQGIIDRLLINLDWPTYDPQIVYPEYTVGTGKVDYALRDPQSKNPRVFIEAKQVGNIEGAEEQLFGYDFRIRVPIAVLTDGQKWRFFHPPGEGTWMERKVRELDLVTTNSRESAHWLERYLSYEAIRTGEADRSIKEDYENLVNQRQVERHLPDAWKNLVNSADELLLELLAEETKELCGRIPTTDQVLAFLKTLKRETELPIAPPLKEEDFPKDSHSKSEMPSKSLSGPQKITVKGRQISLTGQQVDELKTVYRADKKNNPKAGPGGAVKKVLVYTGIIPPHHTNNAWNAVARIVGHQTPTQKRAAKMAQGGSE